MGFVRGTNSALAKVKAGMSSVQLMRRSSPTHCLCVLEDSEHTIAWAECKPLVVI